jgi:hypothetical protein
MIKREIKPNSNSVMVRKKTDAFFEGTKNIPARHIRDAQLLLRRIYPLENERSKTQIVTNEVLQKPRNKGFLRRLFFRK